MLVSRVDAVSIEYAARSGTSDQSTITPASPPDLKEFEYQFRFVLISKTEVRRGCLSVGSELAKGPIWAHNFMENTYSVTDRHEEGELIT